jgi:type IV conjugative transfer system coupling protein TraD
MIHDFVRGGQVSLHSFRMFGQVMVTTLKFGILLFIAATIYFLLLILDAFDVKHSLVYGVAWIFKDFGMYSHMMKVEGNLVSVANILNHPKYFRAVMACYEAIIKSASLSTFITISSLAAIHIVFYVKGLGHASKKELRGNSLVSVKELEKLISKANKKEKYKPYKLAEINFPPYGELLHSMICGSTGTGKTVIISDLVAEIKKRGDKAIIYDKMGIYTERFYHHGTDILLNPFDQRSPKWSIFNEVRIGANFDAIAASLIPMEKSVSDPFWTKAARTIFAEVCSSLFTQGGATNKELVEILLKKDLKEASKLVKGTSAQALLDEQSPKTSLSVMSVLSTYLKGLKHLKDEGELFSIRDWIHDDKAKNCVFITSRGDLHNALMPIISSWIEIAINNTLSLNQSRTRKIWFILDELPSLHFLPSLEQGLAETRQFGGCFVIGVQSMSQLRARYGHDNSLSISSLCGNKVILRTADQETAKWCSEILGTCEAEEFREGVSYGAHSMRDGVNLNKEKTIKHLVLPTEVMNLKNLEGFISFCNQYPIAKIRLNYRQWDQIAEKMMESKIIKSEEVVKFEPIGENIEVVKTHKGVLPDHTIEPSNKTNTLYDI